jgi:transcriptional regulator with XRE-family HTH domain
MSDISDSLRSELRDREYSEGYAESFLNSYIATQIKVIREQRQMKQSDLAKEMGTTQTAISRIENVNYSAWNTKTLKKLARAFRVRLRISFETYGTLPDEVEAFDREGLQRAAREEDPGLLERLGPRCEGIGEDQEQAVANLLNPRANTASPGALENLVIMRPLALAAAMGEGTPNGTLSNHPI